MKKAFIFFLVVGVGIYLQMQWAKRFDAIQKAKTEAAKPSAPPPAAAQEKPAAKPAPPRGHKLESWPPTQADLKGVIPDYDALEAAIRSAAGNLGIQVQNEELYSQMGQMWNTVQGRGGGTVQDHFKYDMGAFDIAVQTRELDPKNTSEKTATFQYMKSGQPVYAQEVPKGIEGVSECWEKITVGRGTEYHTDYITIGGTKSMWIKLTWEPTLKAWVRRTVADRQQFLDGYEKKLAEQVQAANVKAAQPLDVKGVKDLTGLTRAFMPQFEARFLPIFQKVYRSIKWGAD